MLVSFTKYAAAMDLPPDEAFLHALIIMLTLWISLVIAILAIHRLQRTINELRRGPIFSRPMIGGTRTKRDAIREACEIRALVYHSIADYSQPADGFCDACPASKYGSHWKFSDAGITAAFIRAAVVEKLKRGGYTVDESFDAETGEPVWTRGETAGPRS